MKPSYSIKRRCRLKKQGLQYFGVLCFWAFVVTCALRIGYGDNIINMKNRIMTDYMQIPEDISCYRADLTDKEHQENHFDRMSIFLISTSCDHLLTMHDACVIESVVRNHNVRKVNVLIGRPISYVESDDNILRGLRSSRNLQINSINIDEFVKGTPLEGIFTDEFMNTGIKRTKRIREVLKLATLYRFGGVVVDLEMVMAKSMEFLGNNWIGKMNHSRLGGAVMAIDKDTVIGKLFLEKSVGILKGMRNKTDIDLGDVMTKAYRGICNNYEPICTDFKLYEPNYFYPLDSTEGHKYFEEGYLMPYVYGYYMWDRNDIVRTKKSMYTKIMKEFCPSVNQYWTARSF